MSKNKKMLYLNPKLFCNLCVRACVRATEKIEETILRRRIERKIECVLGKDEFVWWWVYGLYPSSEE
jgi:hypothetical protein